MASLGEAVVEVGADTRGFRTEVERGVESALGRASKSMQNVGKKMQGVGTKMTVGVTAPLAAIGVQAVRTASEFESTMNVLQANSGATEASMESLRETAKKLGADTVFSANEAADAMLELSKGGMSAAQIEGGGVAATMALAATEGMELATTAEVIANNMNAFSIEAKNAGKIADILAAGSAASTASVASLSDGLSNVGGTARNFGFDLQDTVGVLAAFDQNAIRGANGGTALNSLLTKLSAPTKKAREEMEKYGIAITNADGTFKSAAEIAGEFERGLGGLNDKQRAAAVTTIAGTFGQKALNALIKEGEDGIKGYIKATGEQGVAQKLADARMSGTAGAVERMRGAIETASLAIGEAMAPAINKVADFIGGLADKFSNLPSSVQTGIAIFGAIAAAIGPVLVIVGTLISAVGTIAGVFAGLTAAVAAPIAAVVLIVGALGLLLYKSQAARDVLVGAFEKIKAAVAPAIEQIGGMLTGTLIPAFEKVWPVIEKVGVIILGVFAGAVVGAIKGAMNVIVGVFKVITGVVKVFSGLLSGDFSKVWEGIKDIFSGALQAIWGVIQVWLNVGVLGIFRKAFGLLKGIISGGWNFIKGIFTSALGAIRGGVQSGLNGVWAVIRGIFNGIKKFIGVVWRTYVAIIRGVIGAIRAVVSGGFNAVRGVIVRVWNSVRSATSAVWNGIKGAVGKAIGAVRNTVTSGFNRIVSFFKSIPGRLGSLAGSFINAGLKLGKSVIQGIQNGINAVGGLLSNIGSKIKSAINSALRLPITLGKGPLKFTIPAFAQGTNYAPGGVALVGERGPELVDLPRGSRVHTAQETRNMASAPSPAGVGGLPSRLILRVGAREFTAYVEEIADGRIEAADSLVWQGA